TLTDWNNLWYGDIYNFPQVAFSRALEEEEDAGVNIEGEDYGEDEENEGQEAEEEIDEELEKELEEQSENEEIEYVEADSHLERELESESDIEDTEPKDTNADKDNARRKTRFEIEYEIEYETEALSKNLKRTVNLKKWRYRFRYYQIDNIGSQKSTDAGNEIRDTHLSTGISPGYHQAANTLPVAQREDRPKFGFIYRFYSLAH
ncbi:protein MAK16 homolog, partial [Daphnia carinata]|uniref:protein MAK16 homolog n=1 Tax=Daphnia carinata TaxID=120202 RepID=UPI002868D22E